MFIDVIAKLHNNLCKIKASNSLVLFQNIGPCLGASARTIVLADAATAAMLPDANLT